MLRTKHTTSRLILRPFVLSDYETWQTAMLTRRAPRTKWDSGPPPLNKCTRSDFNAIVRRHELKAKRDLVYVYPAFDRKSGALVGSIDIASITRGMLQMANLGYVLHNRYWGMGYGKEMSIAAIDIAFRIHKYHRLEAAINLRNNRSVKLARAIGMHYEGIKRNYIFEDGEWVDHHVFVITPEMVGK